MNTNEDQILVRKQAALKEIKRTFGTDDAEYGANLFVSHHLEELDASYWKKHLGAEKPEPSQILEILVLRSHWSDDDDNGTEVFDFTLPDDVTDYVISVRFDHAGEIDEISMES